MSKELTIEKVLKPAPAPKKPSYEEIYEFLHSINISVLENNYDAILKLVGGRARGRYVVEYHREYALPQFQLASEYKYRELVQKGFVPASVTYSNYRAGLQNQFEGQLKLYAQQRTTRHTTNFYGYVLKDIIIFQRQTTTPLFAYWLDSKQLVSYFEKVFDFRNELQKHFPQLFEKEAFPRNSTPYYRPTRKRRLLNKYTDYKNP